MNNVNKKIVISIILLAVLLFLLAGLGTYAGKIKENDAAATGNTGGNLLNGGYFCEDEGIVYFSNPYDNGFLYSMNDDGTDVKRLTRTSVNYINAAGDYLYYYQNDKSNANSGWGGRRTLGIYRSDKKGKSTSCIKRTVCGVISLAGNHLYFQNYNNDEGMTLYKASLDGKEKVQVADDIIDPSCVVNGFIYYSGIEGDHNLYCLDTATDSIETLWETRIWNPIVSGDTVYYMNVADNYCLYRRSLSSDTEEKLTEDRVDTYNLTADHIYYQKNSVDAPALMRIRLDGSEPEEVMSGNFTNISATSQYVYFHEFGNEVPLYRTPADGAIQPEPFLAAKEAAMQQ